MRNRSTIAAVLVALALGWWLASSPVSPIRPEPPRPSRPVLSALSRLAKLMLWGLAFAEPAPEPQSERRVVLHAIGADGHPVIDHGRSF